MGVDISAKGDEDERCISGTAFLHCVGNISQLELE